jgi:hypothetical protein
MLHESLGLNILDERQLKRIEGLHRGFFYQHLYAVGCVLLAMQNNVRCIIVERDEDIEVVTSCGHIYIQVKTRSNELIKSDINGTLNLFDEIKKEHSKGNRPLTPSLFIISNVKPGVSLSDEIQRDEWPDDVKVVWPDISCEVDCLPPAWESVKSGLRWCTEKANEIPYTTLTPINLVLKLTAWVQYLCSGESGKEHVIYTEAIPSLLDQIITQLQSMPEAPVKYYHLDWKLEFESNEPARIISGFPGSGKTAWVAHEAVRIGSPVVYYNVIGNADDTFLPSFVREAAAVLAGKNSKGLGEILLPGSSSLDSLRAISNWIKEQGVKPYVVIDNSHNISSEAVKALVSSCTEVNWVFLSHPGEEQKRHEAALGVSAYPIEEWSVLTVGAVLSANNVEFRLQDCERFKVSTGGLPLYVLNAVSHVQEFYGARLSEFLDEFEQSENLQQTSQERILSVSFDKLGHTEKLISAILISCKGVSLSKNELTTVIERSGGLRRRDVVSSLRIMIDRSIVQRLEGDRYRLHDAFGVFSQRHLESLETDLVHKIKTHIAGVLFSSYKVDINIERIVLQLNLLIDLGNIKEFIEICTAVPELFQELGISGRIRSLVESLLAIDRKVLDEDIFWLLDTLAFWEMQEDQLSSFKNRLRGMKVYLAKYSVGSREYINYYMKEMFLASKENRISVAKKIYKDKLEPIGDFFSSRFAQYNYAVMLHENQQHAEAEGISFSLIHSYLSILGLSIKDIVGTNPPQILDKVKPEYDPADFKRLADCYDLYSRSVMAQGNHYGLARIHAFKFYNMGYALNSAMRVGQDIVDDFIGPLGDVEGARQFIEQSLLPSAEDLKLMDWIIPIRSQYAVVLAYCGDFTGAYAQLKIVEPFRNALGSKTRKELIDQAKLVQAVKAGSAPIPRRIPVAAQGIYHAKAKVGRNFSCPCGSGKKYKKCCGK